MASRRSGPNRTFFATNAFFADVHQTGILVATKTCMRQVLRALRWDARRSGANGRSGSCRLDAIHPQGSSRALFLTAWGSGHGIKTGGAGKSGDVSGSGKNTMPAKTRSWGKLFAPQQQAGLSFGARGNLCVPVRIAAHIGGWARSDRERGSNTPGGLFTQACDRSRHKSRHEADAGDGGHGFESLARANGGFSGAKRQETRFWQKMRNAQKHGFRQRGQNSLPLPVSGASPHLF